MTEEIATNTKQVRGSINVASTPFSLHMYCNTHTAWSDCGLSCSASKFLSSTCMESLEGDNFKHTCYPFKFYYCATYYRPPKNRWVWSTCWRYQIILWALLLVRRELTFNRLGDCLESSPLKWMKRTALFTFVEMWVLSTLAVLPKGSTSRQILICLISNYGFIHAINAILNKSETKQYNIFMLSDIIMVLPAKGIYEHILWTLELFAWE